MKDDTKYVMITYKEKCRHCSKLYQCGNRMYFGNPDRCDSNNRTDFLQFKSNDDYYAEYFESKHFIDYQYEPNSRIFPHLIL